MSTDSGQPLHPRKNDRSPGSARWSSLLSILFISALVLIPIAIYGLRPEIDGWRIAAAHETLASEGYQAAIQQISTAIDADPESVRLLQQRAKWYAESDQHQKSLHDLDRCIESVGKVDIEAKPEYRELQLERINTLTALNKADQAERAIDQLFDEIETKGLLDSELVEPEFAAYPNYLAYFYSRINRKTERAAQLADIACDRIASLTRINRTLAEIYLLLEQDVLALPLYNESIKQTQQDYEAHRLKLSAAASDAMLAGVPPQSDDRASVRSALDDVRQIGRVYQRQLLDRAELHRRAGNISEAEQDAKNAEDLGRFDEKRSKPTAAESLPFLFSESVRINLDAVKELSTASAYIDTRGCVRLRQGDLPQALKDFDLSIKIDEALSSLLADTEPYSTLVDTRELTLKQRQQDRQLATLLYHRMLVHKKLGNETQAGSDRKQIEELGIAIKPSLF